MPGYRLGVDLGTTFTSAAVGTGTRVESVALGDAAPQIPSAVFLREDGTLLFGEVAVQRGVTEPGRLAREFKRQLGDATPRLLGGAPMSAHALTGHLLRHVVDLTAERQGASPAGVVLTHPANWGAFRLELLEQAARVAGLDAVELLPEPAAAAAHFASLNRLDPGDVAAVYDLGGGTFDAAVVRRTAQGFEVLGEPQGLEQVGGVDVDAAVLAHVVAAAGLDPADFDPDDELAVLALDRLRRDCTRAKVALSSDSEAVVPVDVPGSRTSVRITRGELEDAVRPALLDTVAAFGRALTSAGVTSGQLAAVVLVGGSARIPLVKELLTADLRRPVVLSPQPKQSVALGAALPTVPSPVARPATPPQRDTASPDPSSARSAGNEIRRAAVTGSVPPTIADAPASRTPPPRTRAIHRRALVLACLGSLVVAVLVALLAPQAGLPRAANTSLLINGQSLTHRIPVDVASVHVTGLVRQGAALRATLLGATVDSDEQPTLKGDGLDFSLTNLQLLAVGPFRAQVADNRTGLHTVILVPTQRRFLASVPGAVCVLGVLFVAAYLESVLRAVRRRRRERAADVVALAGLGSLTGALLVVTAWGAADRLLTPLSVWFVLLAGLTAGVLLAAAVDPRRQ